MLVARFRGRETLSANRVNFKTRVSPTRQPGFLSSRLRQPRGKRRSKVTRVNPGWRALAFMEPSNTGNLGEHANVHTIAVYYRSVLSLCTISSEERRSKFWICYAAKFPLSGQSCGFRFSLIVIENVEQTRLPFDLTGKMFHKQTNHSTKDQSRDHFIYCLDLYLIRRDVAMISSIPYKQKAPTKQRINCQQVIR